MRDTTRTSLLDIHDKLTHVLGDKNAADSNEDPVFETPVRHKLIETSKKIERLIAYFDAKLTSAIVFFNMILFEIREAQKNNK